ncbi:hypothetical protein DB30_00935 [Enhygromyxa salina]|uniref:Uncharacterized protein n=1 Tax=Enhygromyxa salina TaxID=215803 RepID=A0A0C1ZPC7_9BACT|nr:hypothetical protein [Enhygromyxa salina]KIG12868.1 hypothetical protein DB30_00935 [Enhygromyxa salina]
MRAEHLIAICLPLAVLLGACDATESSEKTADAAASDASVTVATHDLEPGKTAASFQLQAVMELVKGYAVADAKALEAKLNDPEAKLNAVDLDEDGVTDFVEVVEVKSGGVTTLEFRVIPSTKQDKPPAQVGVVIATITFSVENNEKLVVHGAFTDHIDHHADIHVYHHEEPVVYEHGALVIAHGCFFHYIFVLEHEPYHGHHHYIVIEAPHAPHVDVHVHHKHKKHKKHKGHKGKAKGHYKGHGGHGVIVEW